MPGSAHWHYRPRWGPDRSRLYRDLHARLARAPPESLKVDAEAFQRRDSHACEVPAFEAADNAEQACGEDPVEVRAGEAKLAAAVLFHMDANR